MRKHFLISALLVTLILGACQGQSQVVTPQPTVGEVARTPTRAANAAPTATDSSAGAPAGGTAEPASPGCTVQSTFPTPGPTETSLFPPPGEGDWVLGPETAQTTLTEYSDFQCPACAGLAPVLAHIQEQYPDDVRVVYRHFPLMSIHENAALAAQAAEAAGEQDAFWPMHDLLFEKQSDWSGLPKEQFQTWLAEQAVELDLDADQFAEDLVKPEIVAKVQETWDRGQTIMPGTPFLLINGVPWPQTLPMDINNIKAIIDLQRLEKRQFTSCPPMQINPSKQYIATIETEKGEIVIELFPDKAPLAVNNFVFLARNGWFDGITFHRVLPGFMAQTGDPSGTGFGGPGYAFVNENSDLLFDRAGLVAMANAGPNTNGSQFFITYGPAEQLNGGYTIFGEVISGQEVAEAITPRDPSQPQELPPGDKILRVTIEEK